MELLNDFPKTMLEKFSKQFLEKSSKQYLENKNKIRIPNEILNKKSKKIENSIGMPEIILNELLVIFPKKFLMETSTKFAEEISKKIPNKFPK